MLKEFERPDDGLNKEQQKALYKVLQQQFVAQQHRIRDAKLPVIILVEGWASAGKGGMINNLIKEIDPRFSSVTSLDVISKEADRYSFLYPFFRAVPEEGTILFLDGGWMETSVHAYLCGQIGKKEFQQRMVTVNRFERQLRDNGYVLVKLFVNIPKDEQAHRFRELLADDNTNWRVTAEDLWQNEDYSDFRKAYDAFIEGTQEFTPWNILDGEKRRTLKLDAIRCITEAIEAGLTAGKYHGKAFEEEFPMSDPIPRLEDADLSAAISPEAYETELKELQKKLDDLHNTIYRRQIPVVICFEGWDAAGKGGAIRRLAYPLDPRGCQVYPIAAPEPTELKRHFLWRFWNRMPRTGHISIFDRTWYGRVMVERIEGFCTEDDWQRAYNEINEFEQHLTDWGAVVLKFWLHIDQETQLARFTDRQNTPEKRWKITDEDWRNREKWPAYETAVSEMLEKTSTAFAPWHIIEANDKMYARIKVLRTVADALERAIEEKDLKKD